MREYLIFFVFISFLIIQINTNIEDGVYNLISNDINYLVYDENKLQYLTYQICQEKSNFRIKKITNNKYYIEHAKSNLRLSALSNNLILISSENSTNIEWTFIESDNKYIIKNINECYITLNDKSISCENTEISKATKFNLLKIYEEINHTKEDIKLIEKEPIDVLIKYIDLSDPLLIREGIPQIKKDENNEELKYCVRSILKNIPWVRKIFIMMPNKKVRYFKDIELINKKINYVYDKDILGYESANLYAFHFRYWMMEKYNMSENFILMDDDYFIGKPLKKTDFFYVHNGKVVPAIIATNLFEVTKDSAEIIANDYKKKLKNIKRKQTSEHFLYSMYNTFKFTIRILNKNIFAPDFTHNAIPCNTKDIKELYNFTYNSEYKNSTLDALYRHTETLQFQTFYMAYTFNKYNRKVYPIPWKYIDSENAINADFNYPLYCINTGSGVYSEFSFKKTRLIMEYNFPEPTPYEIINYNYLPSLSLDIILEMEKKIKNNRKLLIIYIVAIIVLILIIGLFILIKLIQFIKHSYKLKVKSKKIKIDEKTNISFSYSENETI